MSIRNRIGAKGLVALGCCALFTGPFPGCTIATTNGGVTIRPATAPPPNTGVVIGTFVHNGVTYQLIDVNGDGVPDFAIGPDGQWLKIGPIDVPSAQPQGGSGQAPATQPASRPSTDDLYSGNGNDGGDGIRLISFVGGGGAIDWGRGVDPPMPVEFTLSAAEYIEQYGLDVEPGALIESGALQLNVFDTSSYYTDATFKWCSAFHIPNILTYPDLDYEFYMLRAPSGNGPDFLSLRVAGPASSVARFGLEMSNDDYFEFDFDANDSHWKLVADGNSMTATVYQDESLYDEFSIE